jgi:hypothetical protein
VFTLPDPNDAELTVNAGTHWHSLYKQAQYCLETGQYDLAVAINNYLLFQSDIPNDVAAQVICNRELSLEALYPKVPQSLAISNRIKVFVSFRSSGLVECIDSLQFQDYENFQAYVVDDASSDYPQSIRQEYTHITLKRNETPLGWSASLHEFLTQCDPDDIVFPIDGRLVYCDALRIVNEFFNSYNCSVMYGQYRFSSGDLGLTVPITNREFSAALREACHTPLPFIFRCHVYHDLVSRNSELSWLSCSEQEAADRALYYALLDHCGFKRARFSNQILTIT